MTVYTTSSFPSESLFSLVIDHGDIYFVWRLVFQMGWDWVYPLRLSLVQKNLLPLLVLLCVSLTLFPPALVWLKFSFFPLDCLVNLIDFTSRHIGFLMLSSFLILILLLTRLSHDDTLISFFLALIFLT